MSSCNVDDSLYVAGVLQCDDSLSSCNVNDSLTACDVDKFLFLLN